MLTLDNGVYLVKETENQIECLMDKISYEEQVSLLIRQRYSLDEELAIQRQRDTKPEEFQAYFSFCEECKKQVKEEA
ncbi:MAG: hypothetical protein J6K51_02535 [Clostridia bacterium]|nr:hypothetical protein [Clostridia bacterium]